MKVRIFFVASTDPVAVCAAPAALLLNAQVVGPAAANTALSALQDTTPCRRDAGEILEKGRGSEWVSAGWGRRGKGGGGAQPRGGGARERASSSTPCYPFTMAQVWRKTYVMTTFSPATSAVPTAAPATIPSGDSPTSLDRTITDAPVNAAVAVPRLANARMDANDFIFDRRDEKRLLVHARDQLLLQYL